MAFAVLVAASIAPELARGDSARARRELLRPYRSTAAGDLYRISHPSTIVRVKLRGYRHRRLSTKALRRHLHHGVLALSKTGRLTPRRRVAKARGRPRRRTHGIVLTRRSGHHKHGAAGPVGSSGGPPGVWTGGTSGGAGPGSPAPPGTTNGCAPPYSVTSPWNTPVPAAPIVDPNSAAEVATLTEGTSNPRLGSDPTQYTFSVYTVDSSTPLVPVWVGGAYSNVTSPSVLLRQNGGVQLQLPIPLSAQPAGGSDQQVIVWDRATGDEWGFWEFYDTGSAMGATNGYHYNTLWSGVAPSGFGSRGAGVPYLAGLVRPCEISQGRIDHALAFAYQNTTSAFVSPATKSDGSAASGLPEGAHLQLNPSIPASTIVAWGCTGACLTIARALQTYGMYVIDTSGHPKVYLEYQGTAHWPSNVNGSTTNPIPLSAFRVIDDR